MIKKLFVLSLLLFVPQSFLRSVDQRSLLENLGIMRDSLLKELSKIESLRVLYENSPVKLGHLQKMKKNFEYALKENEDAQNELERVLSGEID